MELFNIHEIYYYIVNVKKIMCCYLSKYFIFSILTLNNMLLGSQNQNWTDKITQGSTNQLNNTLRYKMFTP